ncbi:MAG: hypothetical protein KF753_09220 [Caldilineaceae bacterium]|nr:hypothetical protein [Caldilineaceae bacterium]
MKQNASVDASFWINCCAGGIVEFVPLYFSIFVTSPVLDEIRYPMTHLSMSPYSVVTFDEWVADGRIMVRQPRSPVDWLQPGENAAIALAVEADYWLLIDDANAYHRAKHFGIRVVGTPDFVILLYDQSFITKDEAQKALNAMRVSRKLRRQALSLLESLSRRKEE